MSSSWRNNNVIKTKSNLRLKVNLTPQDVIALYLLHESLGFRICTGFIIEGLNIPLSGWEVSELKAYFRFTSGEAHHKVIHCPSLSIPFQNHLTVLLRGVMKMFRLEDPITVSVLGHLLSTLAHSYNRVITPPVISNLNLASADSISFWTNQEKFDWPIRNQFYILNEAYKVQDQELTNCLRKLAKSMKYLTTS